MAKGAEQQRPIGLVLEGATEYRVLPSWLSRLGVRSVTPSVFDGQPVDASVADLVEYRLLRHVRTQLLKAPGNVVVVLDRESRTESAREFAAALQKELVRRVNRHDGIMASARIVVVVADRALENWLLADPESVAKSRLLHRKNSIVKQVSCHSDTKDAKRILQTAMTRSWYERAVHGPMLARHVRVDEAEMKFCSRSFKAFLKSVQAAPLS